MACLTWPAIKMSKLGMQSQSSMSQSQYGLKRFFGMSRFVSVLKVKQLGLVSTSRVWITRMSPISCLGLVTLHMDIPVQTLNSSTELCTKSAEIFWFQQISREKKTNITTKVISIDINYTPTQHEAVSLWAAVTGKITPTNCCVLKLR